MGKELFVKHDTKYTNKKQHFYYFYISKLIAFILQTLIWGGGAVNILNCLISIYYFPITIVDVHSGLAFSLVFEAE